MSTAPGPGWCHKAMWYGWGGPAGCCDKPAYGPTPLGWKRMPLIWACPSHGGPPKCDETEVLRNHAIEATKEKR